MNSKHFLFEVPGEPRGKGRPRFTKGGHAYTDEKTKSYESLIAWHYKAAGGTMYGPKEPVSISVKAFYKVPGRAAKETKSGMLSGLILPTKKPDLDNIVKAVLDGLNGVAYTDDSCVVEQYAEKIYSDTPRLEIYIKEVKKWNGHR